jgi:hypothetical protein
MNASVYLKSLLLMAAVALLSACGGGGSSNSDGGFTPQGIRVTATAQSTTVRSGETTDILVRVTEANGAAIREGTVVSASVSPASNGSVQGIDAAGGSTGGSAQTVGGNANFRFSAAGPGGTATLTFAVQDPNAPARTVTATVTVNVTAPVDTSLQVIVEPAATTVATQNFLDVVVRVRQANGAPVADGTAVNGVVTPASAGSLVGLPGGTAATASTIGGIANFRFLAGSVTQVAQLVFSVTDVAQGNAVVTGSSTITITPPTGANLRVVVEPAASTVAAQNSLDVLVRVRRADGTPVANGTVVSGLVTPGSAGIVVGAGGSAPTATTTGGVANFRFIAGSNPQVVQLVFSVTDSEQGDVTITGGATVTITPPSDSTLRVTVEPAAQSVAAQNSLDVAVRVRRADGTPVANGTLVTGLVVPGSAGAILGAGDGNTPTATTTGGVANFRFIAGSTPRQVQLIFSVTDSDQADAIINGSTTITITPPSDATLRVTVEPAADTVAVQNQLDVAVRVRGADGTPVADGTTVTGLVIPGSAGVILGGTGAANTATTIGGVANFRFIAGNTAQEAQLIFSVADADQGNTIITGSASITITPATDDTVRITVEPAAETVAAQTVLDVVVRVRRADGTPVANGTSVTGLVAPGSAGTLLGSPGGNSSVGLTTGGVANFRFFAGSTPQVAQLIFSVTDDTNEDAPVTITGTASVTVTPASDAALRVTVEPVADVVATQSASDVVVTVRRANGTPVADGTVVNGVVTPASSGALLGLPAATGPSATTVGGIANFRFLAGATPQIAQLLFSVTDTEQGEGVLTIGTATITVAEADNGRLSIETTTATLPINAFNVDPFLGSPFMAEVTVTVRTAAGEFVTAENGIQVSINPVGNTGGFTTLDDGETDDVNEFLVRLGQGPVDVVAGKATIFVHSLNFSGSTTLTITTQDPDNNQIIVATQVFNIVSSISDLPASVVVNPPLSPIYVQGSGGNTSTQLEILVRDGIGQNVPDPVAGNNAFNNVLVTLLGDTVSGGTRVGGVNAQGQNVQGTEIALRTVSGISSVLLTSGTTTGSALIRVTSDRADNNVDNGVSDPVTAERAVFISDGVLFDLEITQPFVAAILVNPVDPSVELDADEVTVPPRPDGTYSITVGVIATDRLGNPVLPGTAINFGLIDEPQATGAGDFLIAGDDGNPQENGTLFTAPTGAFTTAGGGVGPGDAVVLLTEDDPANRDLEGARVVQTVNGPTSLTVQRAFNRNDVTGSIFDAGNALTYVVGRAADGNITANALTNELGVARTTLNYPVGKIGKFVLVWAQGSGALVADQARTVADAEFLRFAGIAPARLTVNPTTIPGNTTTAVEICAFDALNAPIQAVQVSFAFGGLTPSQGSVDGTPGSGLVAALTGGNGCTVASVTTTGVTQDGATVSFSAVGQTETVDIEVGTLILTANPPSLLGVGGLITLRLVDATGAPVPGVQLTGSCTSTGDGFISTEPANGETGVTDANGEAVFGIFTDNINQAGTPNSGSCTYEAPGGEPNVNVPVQGIDLCLIPTSPPNPDCGEDLNTLTITMVGDGTTGGSLASSPIGLDCTLQPPALELECVAPFLPNSTVSVLATAFDNQAVPLFSGECGPPIIDSDVGVNPPSAQRTAQMTSDRQCTVTFNP